MEFALIFSTDVRRPFLEQKDPRGTLILRLKTRFLKGSCAIQVATLQESYGKRS